MHIVYPLIKGLIFGATMAAIPGPIFFLIVQRTLAEGALVGFLCSMGAVTAEAVYSLIAVIGLTFVTQFLCAYQNILAALGGLFLCYLGITTLLRKPVTARAVTVRDIWRMAFDVLFNRH